MNASKRLSTPRRAWAVAACLVGLLVVLSAPASAQEASPTNREAVYLPQGRPAPFAGALIDPDDLAWFRLRIEQLEHRLTLDLDAARATCAAQIDLERARTQAEQDRRTLHDGLYRQRMDELAAELARSRQNEGLAWFEHPALWFAVGVVVTVAVVIAVSMLGG